MAIKFLQLNGLPEIFNDIAPMYANSIPLEPVLGALEINANLHDVPLVNKINLSSVGAHITDISYKLWGDPASYLNEHELASVEILGKRLPKSFYENILKLYQDRYMLLALTTLLFIDGQMRTFSRSPNPAQDVLLKLLAPIVEYQSPAQDEIKGSELKENAKIRVVLCAGKHPYALTYHDEKSMCSWFMELEAATVLLIPQVVLFTEASLPEPTKDYFIDKLDDQIDTWNKRKPQLGEDPSWDWLPKLL